MLLNKAAVRKFILDNWAATRPGHSITRVSDDAYAQYEYVLRQAIRRDIHRHPSIGQTFKP